MSVANDIEQFIATEITQGAGTASLGPDDDLLATGLVDSHGLMEMIAFLEERYGISVDDDDLTPENFKSLATIEAFVERKRG